METAGGKGEIGQGRRRGAWERKNKSSRRGSGIGSAVDKGSEPERIYSTGPRKATESVAGKGERIQLALSQAAQKEGKSREARARKIPPDL